MPPPLLGVDVVTDVEVVPPLACLAGVDKAGAGIGATLLLNESTTGTTAAAAGAQEFGCGAASNAENSTSSSAIGAAVVAGAGAGDGSTSSSNTDNAALGATGTDEALPVDTPAIACKESAGTAVAFEDAVAVTAARGLSLSCCCLSAVEANVKSAAEVVKPMGATAG
jgi:hypothetical protein